MELLSFRNLIAEMPASFQAFTSKQSTWVAHMNHPNVGEALTAIFEGNSEITISRNDLRSLATEPDLTQFILSTIIWGYPRGMRGNHFQNLLNHFDTLTARLTESRAQPLENWLTHYENIRPITGIGLSTYTKLLSFLSVNVQNFQALILDDRIIRVAQQGIFEELAPLLELRNHNAVCMYPQYLETLHNLANAYEVDAEKIEFFLFEFGLNLKPTQ